MPYFAFGLMYVLRSSLKRRTKHPFDGDPLKACQKSPAREASRTIYIYDLFRFGSRPLSVFDGRSSQVSDVLPFSDVLPTREDLQPPQNQPPQKVVQLDNLLPATKKQARPLAAQPPPNRRRRDGPRLRPPERGSRQDKKEAGQGLAADLRSIGGFRGCFTEKSLRAFFRFLL